MVLLFWSGEGSISIVKNSNLVELLVLDIVNLC